LRNRDYRSHDCPPSAANDMHQTHKKFAELGVQKRIQDLRVIVLTALLAVCAAPLAAAPVTLNDLINGPQSITVGGLVFSNFSYTATGDMPTPQFINVTPFTDGFGNLGLTLQGGFLDLPGGGSSDALIDFHVSVLEGSGLITGATLNGNPNVVGGNGLITATETFLPTGGNSLLSIYDIVPGAIKLSDSLTFNTGFSALDVQIDVLALSNGGIPILSFLDPVFTQSPNGQPNTPEPATVAMMAMGLGGLGLFRRLRRKRAAA
jgi:hypothetical protein